MNLADQVAAVQRSVLTHGEVHDVVLARTFAVAPGEVWLACSTPERLALWFEPVEGDLHEGGRYRLPGSSTEGTVERCETGAAVDVTWEHGGGTSRVAVRIGAEGDHAVLSLTHSVPDDDHWRTYGPAATGAGWDGALLALDLLLAGTPRSPEAEPFDATPEGHEAVGLWTDAWAAAHVAAGADPDQARAAAERTTAFYRGEG